MRDAPSFDESKTTREISSSITIFNPSPRAFGQQLEIRNFAGHDPFIRTNALALDPGQHQLRPTLWSRYRWLASRNLIVSQLHGMGTIRIDFNIGCAEFIKFPLIHRVHNVMLHVLIILLYCRLLSRTITRCPELNNTPLWARDVTFVLHGLEFEPVYVAREVHLSGRNAYRT